MTTATLSPTRPVARSKSSAARTWHYFVHSLGAMLRDWSFMAFIIALPVTMYLFFAGIYGDQEAFGGVTVEREGDRVTLNSADADATLRALFTGPDADAVADVEVASVRLEDAFLALVEPGARGERAA